MKIDVEYLDVLEKELRERLQTILKVRRIRRKIRSDDPSNCGVFDWIEKRICTTEADIRRVEARNIRIPLTGIRAIQLARNAQVSTPFVDQWDIQGGLHFAMLRDGTESPSDEICSSEEAGSNAYSKDAALESLSAVVRNKCPEHLPIVVALITQTKSGNLQITKGVL